MAVWDGATWMGDLGQRIAHMPLSALSLIGTHNSASASITFESDVAPDCPVEIPAGGAAPVPSSPSERVFGKLASVKRNLMLRVAAVWARNQSRSVAEQLALGVRYLDLRVAPNHSRGGLWITHGLFASPLEDVCGSIRAFAEEHPHEVVIADFQHLLHFAQSLTADSLSSMETLSSALHSILGPVAIAPPHKPQSTLAQIWESKRSVLVVVPDHAAKYLPPFVHSRSSTIVSTWHNAQSVDVLVKAIHEEAVMGRLDHATRLAVSSPLPTPLFVTQGVLTPEAFEVAVGVTRLGPSSVKNLANRVNSHATRYFAATCASSMGTLPERQSSSVIFKRFGLRERLLCGCSPDDPPNRCAWCVHNSHRNILMVDYVETAKILAQCSSPSAVPAANEPKKGFLKRLIDPPNKPSTINRLMPHFITAIEMCVHINLRRAAEMRAHTPPSPSPSSPPPQPESM